MSERKGGYAAGPKKPSEVKPPPVAFAQPKSERAAFTINVHVTPEHESTDYVSASCMLCDYATRDFRDTELVDGEDMAKASVTQHIAATHGRRRFKAATA